MHLWSRDAIYLALGIEMGNTTIPRDKEVSIPYAGCTLTCDAYATKRNRLYRVYVTCKCGKTVAFCKMPQHLKAKRHANGTDMPA